MAYIQGQGIVYENLVLFVAAIAIRETCISRSYDYMSGQEVVRVELTPF